MADLLSEKEKGGKVEAKAADEQSTPQAPPVKKETGPGGEINTKIEEERKKKGMLLDNLRRFRRKLNYKFAEREAIAKLAEMSKKSTKNIGYLRRKKESLEFRISTEAYTLDAEKELIRKKNEVEKELEEAIASYRMRRKAEFVAHDIEELTKQIENTNKELQELERRLDVLYSGLRRSRGQANKPRVRQEQKIQEVSFADIAIIKDKKVGKENGA